MAKKGSNEAIDLHKAIAMGKTPKGYAPGRPSKFANGGVVEGVRQRAAIGMGGDPTAKTGTVQTPNGVFQRKK